ncbi:tail completion protein gp17 [Magnetococcus sp. PR-3]|uniref:tail completion protein gp17 n=1 Tax=Magnetococcus sp. PR-3 TaxID=3120355 RepID=UPI002FCDFE39
MSIESDFYTALQHSTVTSLVADRIYPVVAPDKTFKPYLVYARSAGGKSRYVNGAVDDFADMQITAVAKNYPDARQLAAVVTDALRQSNALDCQIDNIMDAHDEETDVPMVYVQVSAEPW